MKNDTILLTQIRNWNWIRASVRSLKLRGRAEPETQRNSQEDAWWEETNSEISPQELPKRKHVFAARGISIAL